MADPALVSTAKSPVGVSLLSPFDVQVISSKMAVREVLSLVFKELSPLSLDAEEAATVELILAEAMNNVVEHAYPADQEQGPICIHCCHKKNGLHFAIHDQGNPMPDGQMPLGHAQNIEVDPLDLPEGGYGWFLIKDLAKDVQYQRVGQENRLKLRIAVAIPLRPAINPTR